MSPVQQVMAGCQGLLMATISLDLIHARNPLQRRVVQVLGTRRAAVDMPCLTLFPSLDVSYMQC